MRVVRKSDLLPAVLVVTKKVRGEKEAADGSDGRRGLDMQGLKPGTLLPSFAARLKSCPDASCGLTAFDTPNSSRSESRLLNYESEAERD